MAPSRIDHLARAASFVLSRRGLGGALGLGILARPGLADAKQNHKHTHKHTKKNKATFNAFGCVNIGNFCKNDDQCCSGVCTGNKCQAHDVSTCQTGDVEAFCGGGADEFCIAAAGEGGFCETTTGNAPYCAHDAAYFACAKDADCVPFCGSRAACVVCRGVACVSFGVATMCASTAGDCTFPP